MSKSTERYGDRDLIPMASKYVVETVAILNRASAAESHGAGRSAPLCLARHTCELLMRDKLGFTYPQIARIMGRDHSSVWQGCRKMRELVQASPAVADMVERAWAIIVEVANKDGGCDMSELRRLVQQNEVLKSQRDKLLTALVGVMRNAAVTDVDFDPEWCDGFLKAKGNVRVQRREGRMRVSFEFPCSKVEPVVESEAVEFTPNEGEFVDNSAANEGE